MGNFCFVLLFHPQGWMKNNCTAPSLSLSLVLLLSCHNRISTCAPHAVNHSVMWNQRRIKRKFCCLWANTWWIIQVHLQTAFNQQLEGFLYVSSSTNHTETMPCIFDLDTTELCNELRVWFTTFLGWKKKQAIKYHTSALEIMYIPGSVSQNNSLPPKVLCLLFSGNSLTPFFFQYIWAVSQGKCTKSRNYSFKLFCNVKPTQF